MLAASSGHAKNFSLQRLAGGRYRRTLLDNVMSVWPVEDPGSDQGSCHKAKMAMAMQRKTTTITSRTTSAGTSMPWGALCGLAKDAQPVIQDVSACLPQHFTPQRGRHGVPEPAGRSCPAPADALYIMTSRLAIYRCQAFHWRPRPVLYLSLTRR